MGEQAIDRMLFHDEALQRKLVAVTAALGIEHWIEDGYLCTHERDQAAWSLRDAVSDTVFPDGHHMWRGGAAKDPSLYERYREYMATHNVRYVEFEAEGARWFLISAKDDPYTWGVEHFVRS